MVDRPDRHGEQAFHRAALDLTGHGQRGEDQHGHREDGADQARHDVEPRFGGRIVARMRPDLERQRRRVTGEQVMLERSLHHRPQRGQRGARCDRISGVGCDQQRGMIAAPHGALKSPGNLDGEQHLARQQEIVELLDRMRLLGETKIGGVL